MGFSKFRPNATLHKPVKYVKYNKIRMKTDDIVPQKVQGKFFLMFTILFRSQYIFM